MTAAKVSDITTAPVTLVKSPEKQKSDIVSLSISLPEHLHEKLMLDSLLGKKPIGTMVEEWIDQNVSLQDVTIGLATMMKNNPVREKVAPDVVMKGISIPISKRHNGMLKMEAIRQQKSIRAILKGWVEENTKDWFYEQIDQDDLQVKKAA